MWQHEFQWSSCGNIELTSSALTGQFQMKRGVAPDPHGSPMLRVGNVAGQGNGCAAKPEPLNPHPLGAADGPGNCVGRRIHMDPDGIFDQ